MRYDLHAHLGMDLNDWLRGDRDWRDLLDLLELLPDGAHYPAALLTHAADVADKAFLAALSDEAARAIFATQGFTRP